MFWIFKRLYCAWKDHRWLTFTRVSDTYWEGRNCIRCGHRGIRCENGKVTKR